MGRLRANPDISSRVHFLKVKVIEVKGQISVSPRSLGRSSPNLERRWRAALDISLRGSFFLKVKVIEVKGQIYVFFCLFPYFSQVLGPIFTKLGGKVEGGPLEGRWMAAPDISLRGSFSERSRSSKSRIKFIFFISSVCSPTSPRSLGRSSPNLVGRLRAAPDISSMASFLKVNVIESKVKFLYLLGPLADLHQTWEGGGRPRILA